MARVREINVFSTSFLDLLSCGMGAVIILLIIFLSRLRVESHDATALATVVVRVDYGDRPRLPFAERWDLDGKPLLTIRPSEDAGRPFEFTHPPNPPTAGRGDEALAIGGADATVTSSVRDGSGVPDITIPYLPSPHGKRCSGASLKQPRERRETTIVLRGLERPARLVYSVERNDISKGSWHYFDEARQLIAGDPPPGRGWMSHTRIPAVGGAGQQFRYAYPLRVEVVVYTTQSPVPSHRVFELHQYVSTTPSVFRVVLVLDPDADAGADPIKEPAGP